MNFMNGTVMKHKDGVVVAIGHEQILLSETMSQKLMKSGYIGKEVILGIRPEHMDEIPMTQADTKINGIVDVVELMGAESYIHVKREEETVVVRVNGTTDKKMGDAIDVYLNLDQMHIFDIDTEERIS